MGELHSSQNWAYFVRYLKIINSFLKKLYKQIVREN